MTNLPPRAIAGDFVGRDRELRVLEAAFAQAVSYATPHTVWVVGARGVGKTRLLREWQTDLRGRHPQLRVIRGRGLERGAGRGRAPSYALFGRLLRDRFGLTDGDAAVEAAARVRGQLVEVLGDKRVSEVAHFLGGYLGLTAADSPFLRAFGDSPRQHEQIARSVLRRFLEVDGQRAPLLIELDDLHWADDESLSLVRELSETLSGAPIVLLCVTRPELFARRPELESGEGDRSRLDLSALDRESSERLFRSLLAPAGEQDDRLVERAVLMTAGNPYFLEQLVRLMIDQGLVDTSAPEWRVDSDRALTAELPLSVEQAVQARISALTAEERDLLAHAAALGNVFWVGALVAAERAGGAAPPATGWDPEGRREVLRVMLQDLEDREYVLRMPDSSLPGEEEFAFKHNLEREQILALAPRAKLARDQLVVAQWLEAKLGDRSEEQLEFLAQLHEGGGNLRRAAHLYLAAGDRARARFANAAAVAFYGGAVRLLGDEDALVKIDLLHNLGAVCALVGRGGEALGHFQEMLRLAWMLDLKAKGGAAHSRIGRLHRTRGYYDLAMTHLQEALRLFTEARDEPGIAATLDDLGRVHWLRGEYEVAEHHHRQALARQRALGSERNVALCLSNLGTVCRDSGKFGEAIAAFEEALELRRAVADRLGEVQTLASIGDVLRDQGEHARALGVWRDALAQARELGDRLHEARLLEAIGETQAELGQVARAAEALAQAEEIARAIGDRRLVAECARSLAELSLALGQLDEARERVEQACRLAAKLGSRAHLGMALRARAQVEAAGGFGEEARARAGASFEEAVRVFGEIGHSVELARSYAAMADHLHKLGAWQEADGFREAADRIFRQLHDAAAAPRVREGQDTQEIELELGEVEP